MDTDGASSVLLQLVKDALLAAVSCLFFRTKGAPTCPAWLLKLAECCWDGLHLTFAPVEADVASCNWVALTIEDSPSATATPRLLEVLSKHGAKATIFCNEQQIARSNAIGFGSGFEAFGATVLRAAVSQGHELGVEVRIPGAMVDSPETALGDINTDLISIRRLVADTRVDADGCKLTRGDPAVKLRKWLRFPNARQVSACLLAIARAKGYKLALPSVQLPAMPGLSAEAAAARMARAARPGAVVAVNGSSLAAPELLDGLLTRLALRGLRATHLSEAFCLSGRDPTFNEAAAIEEAEKRLVLSCPRDVPLSEPPAPEEEEDATDTADTVSELSYTKAAEDEDACCAGDVGSFEVDATARLLGEAEVWCVVRTAPAAGRCANAAAPFKGPRTPFVVA